MLHRLRALALVLCALGCDSDRAGDAAEDAGSDAIADTGPGPADVGPDIDHDAPPPPIVLFHDPASGAGWDLEVVLARDPYDYEAEHGKLRDAVERFLQDGIARMTGKTPPLVHLQPIEAGQPGRSCHASSSFADWFCFRAHSLNSKGHGQKREPFPFTLRVERKSPIRGREQGHGHIASTSA